MSSTNSTITPKPISRRGFNKSLLAMALTVAGCDRSPLASSGQSGSLAADQDQLSADQIKALTQLPTIPAGDFAVTDFGAKGDGVTDCTASIAAAIEACANQGGGRVVVAGGTFKTGPIHLRSNIELHVDSDAELSFVTDPKAYLPMVFTRWEGMELLNYSPLIYAMDATNVAVTGGGVLNGNADNDTWWPWKGPHKEQHWNTIAGEAQQPARNKLFEQAEQGVAVDQRRFGEGSYLRPPMVQFYQCRQVLVEDITIKDSPFWLLHPVLSEDVTVRGVTFISHGPNSDGCDPESCNRVVIENCKFDTGDDCIAIKSGRNNDGRRINVPSRNILVQDCLMLAGHGGVVIGSEISGGINNLHVRRCEMSSPDLERAIRIKTNAARGGLIENLSYSDINIGTVKDVIVVNYFYEEGPNGDWMPQVRNVRISNINVKNAQRVFVLRGFPDNPLSGLSLNSVNVANADSLGVVENVQSINLHNVRVNNQSLDLKALLGS